MKYLLITAVVLLSFYVSAQTTMEEYNYLSKGYKIQMESGLDMKKGYTIREIGEWGSTKSSGGFERSGRLFHLIRDGDAMPCASLIIFSRSSTGWTHYQAIPHIYSDQEIWDKAAADFRSSTVNTGNLGYSWATLKMVSQLATPNAMKPGSAKAYGPDGGE